jgi:hypothetical protein
MRAALAVLVLLLAAGCGGGHRQALPSDIPPQSLTAGFKPGGLADVIVVHAVDWRPLRSAELVAPDGERTPAYSLDVVAPVERGSRMQQITPGAPRPVTEVGILDSTALIRLPDPVRYAKEWQRWHVEVVLGDRGAGRVQLTLAAPQSPPI